MNILGIESSCDETSAAVIADGVLRSNIISSQFIHRYYGGIVPELASRAHQKLIVPVVDQALAVAGISRADIAAVAVTSGPGLIGALLVGVNFAKALAYGLNIPIIGVNHLEAHIYSNFIREPDGGVPQSLGYPFLCLIVSGGHTQLVLVHEPLNHELLGSTVDDAAGEAFDKVGKMLGLGFPGGPVIDRLAATGDPEYVKFPRSFLDDSGFDFSFSGIKTSMLYWLRDRKLLGHSNDITKPVIEPKMLADLCASFQKSVVDVLTNKMLLAVKRFGVRDIAIAGGVSANSELRRRMAELAAANGLRLSIPKFDYCTDNAAMIAQLGWMKLEHGIHSSIELDAEASLAL